MYIYINKRPFVSSEDEIYRRFQYWFLAAPYPSIRLYSSPAHKYIILLLYYYNDWWAGGWLDGWGSHKSTFTVLSATVFEYASIISSSLLISILCFFLNLPRPHTNFFYRVFCLSILTDMPPISFPRPYLSLSLFHTHTHTHTHTRFVRIRPG